MAANRTARWRHSSSPLAKATAAVALAAVTAAAVTGCGASAGNSTSNTIKALWFGKSADGQPARGTTPVTITLTIDQANDFSVNLEGFRSAGTDEVWNSAAWSATAVAVLVGNEDPSNAATTFEVGEQISGPSAGAFMSLGVLADYLGAKVPEDVALTGTILPDGGLGPVGGIPEKLRAAKDAGITKVAIPAGQRTARDPSTGQMVDTQELGRQLGITVTGVNSIDEAYELLVGPMPALPQAEAPPLDANLVGLLTTEAVAATQRLTATAPTATKDPTMQSQWSQLVASRDAALAKSQALLAQGDAAGAFAEVTIMERAVDAWNAQMGVLSGTDAEAARQSLLASATALRAKADAAIEAGTSTATPFLEQLVGLPDALSWGVDARIEIDTTDGWLQSGPQALSDLATAAGDLAEADYDLSHFLPAALSAIGVVGRAPVTDEPAALTLLQDYAQFLGQAAQANSAYASATLASKSLTSTFYDSEFNKAAERVWTSGKHAEADTRHETLVALSTALSYYISSVALVAGLGVTNSTDMEAEWRTQILNQQAFTSQVDLAFQRSKILARQVTAAGMDPSYAEWGALFGNSVASRPPTSSDQLRREGLTYQWYANLQGRLLTRFIVTQTR